MLRGKDLDGRTVVDVDDAKKLGQVDGVLVQPDGKQIAGLLVSRGRAGGLAVGGGEPPLVVPAAAIHAIGEDAITIRQDRAAGAASGDLTSLPRLSKLIGHKLLTEGGKDLGSVGDVWIDGADGRII